MEPVNTSKLSAAAICVIVNIQNSVGLYWLERFHVYDLSVYKMSHA
jgi:hypothetical protein